MIDSRVCGCWCALLLLGGGGAACNGTLAGADAITDGSPPPTDTPTGDSGRTKPFSKVGGADPEGKGWFDWSSGKGNPEILKGPQGGQHIWVSARTANLHPKKARIMVTMYLETAAGDQVVKPGTVEMTGTLKWESDWLVYTGLPAFVKEPCVIRDKKVRVELAVDDLYGVHAEDKAWIWPVWKGYCEGDP